MTRARDNSFNPFASQVAGKNAIINGAMDVWQRGTSIAFGNNYTADRWHGYHSAGLATMSRSTDRPTGFQYSLKAQRNASATSTDVVYTSYMMESADSYRFQGQIVTVSFYAKAGANYSAPSNWLNISLRTTTSTNGNVISGPRDNSTNIIAQNVVLTTSWQRFSYTGTVGSTANQLAIVFGSYNSGTAGADDAYYITGVQLELGSIATPFSRAGVDIQAELAKCQRYFQTILNAAEAVNGYENFGIGVVWTTNRVLYNRLIPVTMRTSPAISLSTVGDITIENASTGGQQATNYDFFDYSPRNFSGSFYCAGTPFTVGQSARFRASATTNARIYLSAEL